MAGFLMKPKVDVAFKEIMMNKKARIGFLSAVLKISPEEIRETRILNASLRKEHKGDKLGILDVRVLLNDDTEIDIEIQLTKLKVWADRSLFYVSKMYAGQISESENYTVFKKCVSISVLDFDLFKGETEFYSCFHIREDSRGFAYTDKMEFHVIELPKLPGELKEDCSSLELWARFINAERKEEFDMLAQKDSYIASAYRQLQAVSRDKTKRLEYEARQKAILDYNQIMLEAREDGEKRGREQGERIGEKRGREQGEKIGEKRGREQGEERLNRLNLFLINEDRYEDLKRSAGDRDFRQQLMKEYGI